MRKILRFGCFLMVVALPSAARASHPTGINIWDSTDPEPRPIAICPADKPICSDGVRARDAFIHDVNALPLPADMDGLDPESRRADERQVRELERKLARNKAERRKVELELARQAAVHPAPSPPADGMNIISVGRNYGRILLLLAAPVAAFALWDLRRRRELEALARRR